MTRQHNTILLFCLKCLRKIKKIIFRKKTNTSESTSTEYTIAVQKSSDLISDYIQNDKPCMIARFGSVELSCVANYLKLSDMNFRNAIRYMKEEDVCFEWDECVRDTMRKNAGFFPENNENLVLFAQLMLDCIPDLDILGSWLYDEKFVKEKFENAKTVELASLEPYYHEKPWTRGLEGKRVLVIHPFAETIKQQYMKRENLFKNKDVLPEFTLETIKAVQSVAYTECGFNNWFDALDSMKAQILKKEYDVAIIGCGAYGFPLASFVKRQNKKAVHLGGATQVLFGIKGGRWDAHEFISKLYNEYWVRPNEEDTPKNAKMVEGGCYW